ncbi:GM26631 [Drosophila sechellia]|uniref:GM26631 n=1 Tax=Drosophila sechellia TaxID=7238 RepID=B4HHL3_DROSE|nr:GM26631 [Drosophila sechellia]
MQPLKRFTQCGSLTMLFGIFIILFGVSSTALTTFGKTNNQPPPTHVPIEAAAFLEASSVMSQCLKWHVGLRHKCNSDNDC